MALDTFDPAIYYPYGPSLEPYVTDTTMRGGRRKRVVHRSTPLWSVDLNFDGQTDAEAQYTISFFNAHQETFYFYDVASSTTKTVMFSGALSLRRERYNRWAGGVRLVEV